MLTIEKNVPLPAAIENPGIYAALGKMEPGDSVLVPANRRSAASNAMTQHRHRKGMKFRSKRDGDGIRIWRVE